MKKCLCAALVMILLVSMTGCKRPLMDEDAAQPTEIVAGSVSASDVFTEEPSRAESPENKQPAQEPTVDSPIESTPETESSGQVHWPNQPAEPVRYVKEYICSYTIFSKAREQAYTAEDFPEITHLEKMDCSDNHEYLMVTTEGVHTSFEVRKIHIRARFLGDDPAKQIEEMAERLRQREDLLYVGFRYMGIRAPEGDDESFNPPEQWRLYRPHGMFNRNYKYYIQVTLPAYTDHVYDFSDFPELDLAYIARYGVDILFSGSSSLDSGHLYLYLRDQSEEATQEAITLLKESGKFSDEVFEDATVHIVFPDIDFDYF